MRITTPPQHQLLSRIVWMRSISVMAQLLVVMAGYFWADISLPLTPLLIVIGALAAFNGWTWWRMRSARPASDLALFLQLFVDITALSSLLYFSGGATNPFVSFYLPALAVAAAIFPWRLAFALAAYSFAGYSLLTYIYLPLHIHNHDKAMGYHLAGMWLNFAVSSMLITWFVTRMSATLRERDGQLAQAREQYLHSQRIVGLGAQAAGIAHEMGTPLSTVAVIAGELRHEAHANPALTAYSDDLIAIETQIAICKTALDRMGSDAEREAAAAGARVNLSAWLRRFADNWRLRYPVTTLLVSAPDSDVQAAHAPVLGQILLTLLDNAAQAIADRQTAGQIQLALLIGPDMATLRVTDNGAGIAAPLLKRLGQEAVASTSGGQGIGLMLAFANARQIHASIVLTSTPGRGAMAELTIPWTS